jgi:hypothetical protein
MDAEAAQRIARILLETGAEAPKPSAKLPGDRRALRGIPVAGYGGAIAGTRPELEIERLDDPISRDS